MHQVVQKREQGEHTVCEDLLLSVLKEMPSKNLIPLRRVSRLFLILVDEILRGRFVKIANCPSTEIILESCAPYNSREACRQPLVFSHFVSGSDSDSNSTSTSTSTSFPVEGVTAHFSVATREPLYLPLDDHEVFANNILGVTLESIEPKPLGLQDFSTQQQLLQQRPPIQMYNRALPPKFFSDFSWQLSLASSLDRLFREWFAPDNVDSEEEEKEEEEEKGEGEGKVEVTRRRESIDSNEEEILSLSPSPSPSSTGGSTTPENRPRSSRTQLLNPSNHWPTSSRVPSAFKSASLECLSHEGAKPPPIYLLSCPPPGSGPGFLEFEYYIKSVCLDVGKVVVATEQGLKGKPQCPFVVFA
ncbi:hypothetical protein JCM3765_005501 [Sporobolomyces pararoseus]